MAKRGQINAFRVTSGAHMPGWFVEGMTKGEIKPVAPASINMWGSNGVEVNTPHGLIHAHVGDWVLHQGGRFHVVKAESFERTYDSTPSGRTVDYVIRDDIDDLDR